jgi:plastocyanin
MRRRFAIPTLCLALTAGFPLAGCGGDDNNDSGGDSTSTPAATTTGGGGGGGGGGTVDVSIKDIKFAPHDVTVKVGQTVHWTNDDPVPHTVTATSGAKFDSGTVNGGGTFDFKATKAGTIKYVCTIHPGQDGTITVQ